MKILEFQRMNITREVILFLLTTKLVCKCCYMVEPIAAFSQQAVSFYLEFAFSVLLSTQETDTMSPNYYAYEWTIGHQIS